MSAQHLDYIARAPLLDRLTDLDTRTSREPRPLRTLSYQELLASVRREVEDILNSRCPFAAAELADRPRTVLEYGAPDFSELSPMAVEDQKRICRELAAVIETFEPRLRDVYLMAD